MHLAPIATLVMTLAAGPPQRSDSRCYYTDKPGTTRRLALPNGYRAEFVRAPDSTYAEEACTAVIRDAKDKEVWRATGFGAELSDWSGRDIDNDGTPDAVLAIDTGGGNKCCWGYHVFRLTPRFGVIANFEFVPFFDVDERGRTILLEIVPFYDMGPNMAESPTVTLVSQFRDSKLVDITIEQCTRILADTAHRLGSLAWDREKATPSALAASRRMTDVRLDSTGDVSATRAAAASIALQHLACGKADDARRWISDAWPPAEAPEVFARMRDSWAKRAGKTP